VKFLSQICNALILYHNKKNLVSKIYDTEMDDDNNLAIHFTIHNGHKNRKLPMKHEEVPGSWLGLGEDPEEEDYDDEIEEEETLGLSLSINCQYQFSS
jgi:hypothetical protein